MQKRRTFLKKAGSLAGIAALPIAALAQKPIKSNFIHMVFFWLKDTSEENVLDFIKASEGYLKQIKEIDSFFVGTPADTKRDIVERSYTVSSVVEFTSKKEHDIYQDHPAHLKYVEENSDRWTKVQVFDADR